MPLELIVAAFENHRAKAFARELAARLLAAKLLAEQSADFAANLETNVARVVVVKHRRVNPFLNFKTFLLKNEPFHLGKATK